MSKFFLAVVVVTLSACAPKGAAEIQEDVKPAAPAAAAPADTTATTCDIATKKCEAVAK